MESAERGRVQGLSPCSLSHVKLETYAAMCAECLYLRSSNEPLYEYPYGRKGPEEYGNVRLPIIKTVFPQMNVNFAGWLLWKSALTAGCEKGKYK